MMGDGVLLFGGARGTGLAAAKILKARGQALTVCVRSGSDRSALEAAGIDMVVGNVLDPDTIKAAFSSGEFAAVLNCVGGIRGEPRPDHEGAKNIVDAALAAGVQRMVMLTAVGAGDSREMLSSKAWEILGPVIELKTLGEEYLAASGLDYTILRPGGMNSDPATGMAIKTEDHAAMGTITRADLAQLVVDCLDDNTTIGKIFHTIDPSIKTRPPLQRGQDLPSESRQQ